MSRGVALCCALAFACGCGGNAASSHRSVAELKEHCSDVDPCSTACDRGDSKACYVAGVLHELGEGTDQSYEDAARRFEKACDGEEAKGCNRLGVLHEIGLGVEQSYELAAELYARACQGGDRGGCTNLGLKYYEGLGVERDVSRARELFDEACSAGSALACEQQAGIDE